MTEKRLEELIQKNAQGTASEAELLLLNEWYQSQSIAEVPWPDISGDEEQDVYHRMLQRLQKEIAPKQRKIFRLSALQVAALLLLVVGMGVAALWYKNAPPDFVTITNLSQKVQEVNLPDGSTVWLNAATTFRYQKDFKKHRNIKLEGEAFFNVTADAAHPFTVDAGEVQTTVLGTSFNIKAYKEDDSTQIAVVSGRVMVGNKAKDLAQLTPSMQLSVHRLQQVTQTYHVDTTSIIAWREGRLFFDGEPLSEIIKVLERWYGVHIKLNNQDIKACRYYMSFENNISLEKLLDVLAEVGEMKYEINRQTGTINLSGEGCLENQEF